MKPSLGAIIDRAPLVVCLGPGGVGKTTISAVLALRQAIAGRRALVLTIDPARRLGDALGVPALGNDPAPVVAFAERHPRGTLAALMLDPGATFDAMIARLVEDPARRAALLQNRTYQHISKNLAGTLEYMAVERLHTLGESRAFDGLVLDTPPTTNAFDFLDAPDRLATFFTERVMRAFSPGQRKGLAGRLLDRAGAAALGVLARVAGESFVEDAVGFVAAFGDLFAHFRARGLEVGRLLRHPGTVFLVVTAPDAFRNEEAATIARRLTEAGCAPRGFIVNRVEPAPSRFDAAVRERAGARLAAVPAARRDAFLDRLAAACETRATLAAQHRDAIDALAGRVGGRPIFTAPAVPVGQGAREALLEVYDGLFAGEPHGEDQG